MIRQCTVRSLHHQGDVRATVYKDTVALRFMGARGQLRWLPAYSVRKLSLTLAKMADQMDKKG